MIHLQVWLALTACFCWCCWGDSSIRGEASAEVDRTKKLLTTSKLELAESIFSSLVSNNITLGNSPLSNDGHTTQLLALRDVSAHLVEKMKGSLHVIYDNNLQDAAALTARAASKALVPTVLLTYGSSALETIFTGISSLAISNVFVYCSTPNVLHIFQEVANQAMESYRVTWFVWSEEEGLSLDLQDALREGTQVVLVTRITPSDYSLQSSRVDPDNVIRFYQAGWWKRRTEGVPGGPKGSSEGGPGGGEIHEKKEPKLLPEPDRLYSDMRGRKIIVTANHNLPHFGLLDLGDGTSRATGGVDATILESLSQAMNFTYQLMPPADGMWGGIEADGTITGMIGLVARHEALMAICQITITASRETVVDFGDAYWLEGNKMVTRAPSEKDRMLAVLSPFRAKAWAGIILAVVLIGPIVTGFRNVGRQLLLKECQFSLASASFNMYRSMVIQGNQLPSDMHHLRCIFVFWYFFSLICYALYSGTLTAVLAVPSFEETIESLEHFVDWGADEGYSLRLLEGSSDVNIFRDAKEGIYREAWSKMEKQDPAGTYASNPDAIIEGVLDRKHVALYPQVKAEMRTTELGRGKYHIGRGTFGLNHYGVACMKGAPFRNTISQITLRLTEAGLIPKWTRDEVAKAGLSVQDEEDDEGRQVSLSINDMQAAFYIWLAGQVIATVSLVIESCLYFWLSKTK